MKVREAVKSDGVTHHSWIVWCPACSAPHQFDERWKFDGNMEAPTFEPSLLVHGVEGAHPNCHSFLRAGKWQYLGDCTHAMKNQTVDLPDWPYADGEFGGVK